MDYNPREIEKKWQKIWKDNSVDTVTEDKNKKKYYCLEMFPYPSGKLHMGHVRNYSIGDVISRYKRLQGFNVLHPFGWDSFGLPAENAAIKHGVHPAEWTYKNIDVMREQIKSMGFAYDWTRELATSSPEYYKWEQLFFIKMLEKGLAYKKQSTVNWCETCKTVLANEQVQDGKCWRCTKAVTTKEIEQWFLRITNYAQELLDGCDKLPGWPERVLTMQRNWIGRSDGVEVDFAIKPKASEKFQGSDKPEGLSQDSLKLKIYTTRPDTIYGVTFMSIAPEHPLTLKLCKGTAQEASVLEFVEKMRRTSKIERTAEGGLKEGIFTGAYAINPLNNEEVPIYTANFVLMDYGTGAVMAVPGHDERDFDFAKKYKIPIKRVIYKDSSDEPLNSAYTEAGTMLNSAEFDGMDSETAKLKIADLIETKKLGKKTINYRLKDWGISRQRYWGCPIPVIYCDKCGMVPVPEKDLPVVLPEDAKLTSIGDDPLSRVDSFINVSCPKCKGAAKRETNTMDTFVESSWYYARYTASKDEANGINKSKADYWLPVDQYIGGIEHAVMHLLYVRFFHKVLRDMGYFSSNEPAQNLLTQGMVIKDGAKMSKSIGNIVDPDYIIEKYGADTARLFMLFAAPAEKDLDWSDHGVEGCWRFISRVWRFVINNLELWDNDKGAKKETNSDTNSDDAMELSKLSPQVKKLRNFSHKVLQKVSKDLDNLAFNTALSSMMELVNELYKLDLSKISKTDLDDRLALKESLEILVIMLSPFAPHTTSELWDLMGKKIMVVQETWPKLDSSALVEDTKLIVIQVNGKLRGKIEISAGTSEEKVKELALNEASVKKYIEGKNIKKVIYVEGKLLSIALSDS
jgi:leucyl-tRNA synthetase